MSRSKLSDVEIRGLKVKGASELAGAASFNGATTFNSTSTFVANPIIQGIAPLTSTSSGTPGQIVVESSTAFFYVCIASNSWARVALTATTAFN